MGLVLMIAAVSAGPASAAGAGQAPAVSDSTAMIGANTGVLFNSGNYSRAAIDAQLAGLARTGATTVRSDALWEDAEPKPPAMGAQLSPPFVGMIHHYNWRMDDEIAGMLAAHGLRWLPIIDYSAPWAESIPGDDHSAPSSVGDYASYAAALAARYGPGGAFWQDHPNLPPLPVETYEIWNEPDSRFFWHPSPNPAAYARLYTTARAAIVTVEPTARVIIGGLTRPSAFLPALLSADPDIEGQIDGVAIHPYGATPDAVLSNVRSARLAMQAAGLALVPLYVTEFGWTTHPAKAWDWAPKLVRPSYISATLAALGHTDCGLASVFLYAWVTPERNPANGDDWYGISPPNAGPSSDTEAFSTGIRHALAPGPVDRLCSGPDPFVAPASRSSKPASRSHRRARRHRARHRSKRGRG